MITANFSQINFRLSQNEELFMKKKSRGYQLDYSTKEPKTFNEIERRRKARTIVAIVSEYLDVPLYNLSLLDVGGSTGIIDDYLSNFFSYVLGVDIDEKAIKFAKENYQSSNLKFEIKDAMNLHMKNESFDVVICTHVYEHVPDASQLMDEIYDVLKPNGVVYFSAGNRLSIIEPHYRLPFLSIIPRFLAHKYVRIAGKADFYYERHLSYWGLKQITRKFHCTDYTLKVITDPGKYKTEYMLKPGSIKTWFAKLIAKYFIWLVPGYIWVLKKPGINNMEITPSSRDEN